ncbi:hypothetical protein IGI04_040546 [Brassica rapa subsp. trilocularis]|uniref:F-box domain-containing protein n=1 Tax=Brassica rapa subsp. trilocularis TaxID=1813537 RepID=A0ABQ7KR47_BRACM|nr:hypothetical protein IGI04_040007 [Brassica rapa subsp. trilocularis]KAG5375950.1 hypothetical protein IGI04_040546 [Brassica rapa subsp. trilocularis]
MHFMIEDFPQSILEVFRSLLPKVTLENFSEDSWKNFRRLLKDSRKTLGRLCQNISHEVFGKSSEVLCPKW